jgi:hypothetical protein
MFEILRIHADDGLTATLVQKTAKISQKGQFASLKEDFR